MTANQTRSKFIDFQQLKQEIKIEDAMPLLGLQVSQSAIKYECHVPLVNQAATGHS